MYIVYKRDGAPSKHLIIKMKEAAKLCLERAGIRYQNTEISLTFTDPEQIQSINKEYRNIDSVTDVLSFPQYEDISVANNDENIFLGDVVICRQQAAAQAEEYGHSEERELVYLFVHSMFHLLGYDHMEEAEKVAMRAAEEDIMKKIGLSR